MKLIKCPRCELNYIQENEKLCKVCQRELKGSQTEDEMELCSVCNAAPALPGRDVCLSCLKEMANDTTDESIEERPPVVDESKIGINSVRRDYSADSRGYAGGRVCRYGGRTVPGKRH
mgnify:CR=1 FL=1